MAKIKNPTVRKVRNAGFEPVVYHTDHGQESCWIEKVGRKLLHVRFAGDQRLRRVPKSERRYMRVIA